MYDSARARPPLQQIELLDDGLQLGIELRGVFRMRFSVRKA
jgi:hypothetical protein